MKNNNGWSWLKAILPATKLDIEKLKGLLMATLTDLETQVKANEDAEASAIALIEGLAAKIEAIKTDPTKIQALADELKASSDKLGAAVVANTPAAP